MAILTDGREWNFFLPAGHGDYADRRVYKLDMLEREVQESAERLKRYLHYDAIKSGDGIRNAQDDYRDISRVREMNKALPEAWKKLLEEEDEILLELVADRVESICGYKPDLDSVARYLKEKETPTNVIQKSSRQIETTKPKRQAPTLSAQKNYYFVFEGHRHNARNAKDVMVQVFELFHRCNARFCGRFAEYPNHG